MAEPRELGFGAAARAFHWRAYGECRRKRRYAQPEVAERQAAWWRRRGDRGMHAYRCRHCRGWHIGHGEAH